MLLTLRSTWMLGYPGHRVQNLKIRYFLTILKQWKYLQYGNPGSNHFHLPLDEESREQCHVVDWLNLRINLVYLKKFSKRFLKKRMKQETSQIRASGMMMVRSRSLPWAPNPLRVEPVGKTWHSHSILTAREIFWRICSLKTDILFFSLFLL